MPEPDITRFDLNRDGVINQHDMGLLLAHWKAKAGDPNFLYCLDFNTDGVIDIYDVTMMAVHYGKNTGEYAYATPPAV